jgi:Large polyvalent protein associated domain 29
METTERRIDLVEVAKMVRAELRREFPGVTFRVRSRRYSMGCSIDVSWTDGPTSRQVEGLVGPMQGADFDGMVDLKTYRDPTLVAKDDGSYELRKYGVDYIMCHRSESAAVLRKLAHEVAEYAALDTVPDVIETSYGGYIAPDLHLPISVDFSWGKLGAGLAIDRHRGEYFQTICRGLWSCRDYSRPCNHSLGTYPAGKDENGRHRNRCRGCGMRTFRRIETDD